MIDQGKTWVWREEPIEFPEQGQSHCLDARWSIGLVVRTACPRHLSVSGATFTEHRSSIRNGGSPLAGHRVEQAAKRGECFRHDSSDRSTWPAN